MSKARPTDRMLLRIGMWIAQLLIAVPFLGIGIMKLGLPIDQLGVAVPWAAEYPRFVRVIGAIDVAGGLGILLPALTRIKPWLTIWAAIGCGLLMVCAIMFHVARGEGSAIGLNVVLLALSGFVWWGRSKTVPVAPR